MKTIDIYTYSICEGKATDLTAGFCAWTALLSYNTTERMLFGISESATKNRADLFSVYSALKALKEPCEVHVFSDSQFITNAYNLSWITRWESRGWMLHKSDPVPNADIWQALLPLLNMHTVSFTWVRKTDVMPKMQTCKNKAAQLFLLNYRSNLEGMKCQTK